MSIAKADIETAISVASVNVQDTRRVLEETRCKAPHADYSRALSALLAAEADYRSLVSQRERMRADEVAFEAERAGI